MEVSSVAKRKPISKVKKYYSFENKLLIRALENAMICLTDDFKS
jgi:hypothetical protein